MSTVVGLSGYDIGLLVAVLIVFGLVMFLFLKIRKVELVNQSLFEHAKGKTVEELLKACIDKVTAVDQQNVQLLADLQRAHQLLTQRVCTPVLKRYNSYDDVGGNQSFSVAIIDPHASGLILSALHSRQGAMVYAKWVERGLSPHNLSAEEQEVLAEAVRRNLP